MRRDTCSWPPETHAATADAEPSLDKHHLGPAAASVLARRPAFAREGNDQGGGHEGEREAGSAGRSDQGHDELLPRAGQW